MTRNLRKMGEVCAKNVWLAVMVGLFLPAVAAEDNGERWLLENAELPGGIRISLSSDRKSYFLGENILLYYRVENVGNEPFKISVGGDYRGGTRADRFKVTATSNEGGTVADPTPGMRNMGGGLMPGAEIQPGTSWFEHVHVIDYCRFDAPGTYRVCAFHDLGFKKPANADPREVSMSIELLAPTEPQAAAILADAENAKPYGGSTWGEKGEVRLDYQCIRWPSFLKPLVARAQAGSADSVDGIASIRNLDATRALVDLLGHADLVISKKAADLLEWRMPYDEKEFEGPWGDRARSSLVNNAWDEKLSAAVRDYSVRLLASPRRSDLMTAASLLRRVGTVREVPVLLKALDFGLAQTSDEFLADIQYPSPRRVCDLLLSTALALDPGLDISPGNVSTPGQALLFIATHCGEQRELSDAEVAECARLLSHELPYVRMKMIGNLPKEIPVTLAPLVMERMTDPNPAVQNNAFEAAGRLQAPRHKEIALSVLKNTGDSWLRRSAHQIVMKYGARYDCAVIWSAKLTEGETRHDAVIHLLTITAGKSPSGGINGHWDDASVAGLRSRWQAFLAAQKDRIRAGDVFTPGDGQMPADLMPEGFSFSR